MTIRILAALLIISCGGLLGFEFRRKTFVRVKSLVMIRDYLKNVKSCISHTGMSLEDIAVRLDERNSSDNISLKIREYIQHEPFYYSFLHALGDTRRAFCLTDSDIDLMASLVKQLGCYDLDEALSCLSYADEQLSFLISDAERKCETEGKIDLTLGISVGAIAALILF